MERPPYPRDAQRAFNVRDRTWLCLTTLHHRRFVEDSIHLLGLPRGATMRLRYRRPYIDEGLWNRVSEGDTGEGAFALVVLAATDPDGTNIVRPLRKTRIRSARCEGSVLILDITLDDFVIDLIPGMSLWSEVQQTGTGLPKSFGPTPRGGMYLQELPAVPERLSASRSIEGWERSAHAFFEVAVAEAAGAGGVPTKIPFLYFLAPPPYHWYWRLSDEGVMDLEAGRSLTLEVHTMADPAAGVLHNPAGEVLLELSHPAATFSSSRRIRVDSRRDVRSVRIATPALFRRAYGHLSVRTVVFASPEGEDAVTADARDRGAVSAKKRDESVMARYDFPLGVGRGTPVAASLLVSLAAGVATYKAPADGADPTWASIAIPAIVALLAFVGLLLGLRKDGKA